MLTAQTADGTRILGWDAVRDGTYFCPECGAPVIFKSGRTVTPHFAHKPPTDCAFAVGESVRHLAMKAEMRRWFAGESIEFEVPFPPDHRADVVLPTRRVVIECQASKLLVSEWERRTRAYNRAGYAVLWLWDYARLRRYDAGEKRIPDELRECHKQTFGRVYVLNAQNMLAAAHLEAIYRPPSDWPDDYGYWPRTLRAVRLHYLDRPLRISSLCSPGKLTLAHLRDGVWWKNLHTGTAKGA